MNYFSSKPGLQNPSQRLISKSGSTNIKCVNIEKQRLYYLLDGFTTVLELQWRWVVCIFFSGFLVSWCFFALLWFALMKWHGDLDNHQDERTPCIWNVHSFSSVLLFSMETQTTIGYGYRYVSEECEIGVFLLVLQSLVGAMLQALLAGAVLAKIQIPKSRRKTVLFSDRACICLLNAELCLLFRVGNIRKSEIVGAQVRAIFVKQEYTEDGELLPQCSKDLKLGFEESGGRMHLWWPTTIIHVIDESSPFWSMSPQTLKESRFEVILVLEGSIASTSLSFQARTSYLPREIDWGQRFQPMFKTRDPVAKYEVDFRYYGKETPAPCTPRMSAEDWRSKQTTRRRNKQTLYSLSD